MEAKTAKGAKAWLELATSTSLPILKASAVLLTKQIKSGASLADMAHTIERDPALCLHLFLAANQKNNNPDVEILTLNHVMTMLGMQGVIHYLKQVPKMSLLKSDAPQKAYIQAQTSSALAGALVGHWAEQTHSGSAEKLKWATIIAGAPLWYMWHVGYSNMSHWQYRTKHEFELPSRVEQDLFGCSLEDICRMLGRRIQLPSLSQQLLERAEWPSLRQWGQILSDRHMMFSDDDHTLRFLKSKPSTVMLLLNHLAQQSQWGWLSHSCLRAQRALAHLSGLDINHVLHQNHDLVVQFSRHLMAEQMLPPAATLVWPQQPMNQPPWVRQAYLCWEKDPNPAIVLQKEPRPTAKAAPQGERVLSMATVAPRQMDRRVLLNAITQLNKQVSEFNDIHKVFLSCINAIQSGIGMGRGFICILNKTGDCLRPVYCFGIDADDPIRQLRINLGENRLFTKLLDKIASFRIDADNVEQAINMLEPSVVRTLKRKNCMVMSLFSMGKPIGVVYADVAPEEQAINDQEYQAFKKVCQSTSHALERYAKR